MVQFKANQVKALIDSGSEVNIMTPGFAAKISLAPTSTKVATQTINVSALKMYDMVIARFLI